MGGWLILAQVFWCRYWYWIWKSIGKRWWLGGTHLGPSKSFVVAAGRGRTLNWHHEQPYFTIPVDHSFLCGDQLRVVSRRYMAMLSSEPSTGLHLNLTLQNYVHCSQLNPLFSKHKHFDIFWSDSEEITSLCYSDALQSKAQKLSAGIIID